ncbi:MAG TPA: DUF5677 domain-containing protein [Nitrospira sp.]|nr:DUF5677 domain-containing protein [Nitrospira sp.]
MKLADAPWVQTRDSFSVVRAVFELGVNICYIISVGSEAAERALRHTRQKAFRDLHRVSEIAEDVIELRYSGKQAPSDVDGMTEDLAEFSTKKGVEKREWIDLNVDERIATVGQHLGKEILSDLHFARFMVYRHSSEVLHGTHFGVQSCFGLTTPGTNTQADALAHMGDQQMMILMAANLTVLAVAKGFHVVYGHAVVSEFATEAFDEIAEVFRRNKPHGGQSLET